MQVTRRMKKAKKVDGEARPIIKPLIIPPVQEVEPTLAVPITGVYDSNFRPPEKINAICIGGPSDGKFASVDPTDEWPMVNGARYERTFVKLKVKYFFALVHFNPDKPIAPDDMMQMLLCGYRGAAVGTPTVTYSTNQPTGRKFDFSV